MTIVALFGAGGKMGMRLGRNLVGSRFIIRPVEVSPAGQERVKTVFGQTCFTPMTLTSSTTAPKRRCKSGWMPSWRAGTGLWSPCATRG